MKLDLTVDEPVPAVLVDPVRMAQVIGNLISNALRHTPPGGSIAAAVQRDEQSTDLLVKISDTREGIEAAALAQVFDRFYRLEPLNKAVARGLVPARSKCDDTGDRRGRRGNRPKN